MKGRVNCASKTPARKLLEASGHPWCEIRRERYKYVLAMSFLSSEGSLASAGLTGEIILKRLAPLRRWAGYSQSCEIHGEEHGAQESHCLGLKPRLELFEDLSSKSFR